MVSRRRHRPRTKSTPSAADASVAFALGARLAVGARPPSAEETAQEQADETAQDTAEETADTGWARERHPRSPRFPVPAPPPAPATRPTPHRNDDREGAGS
ncbi:hypothetical protein ACWGDE_38880 [Streptomyces sp. NPDC054956]